MDNDEGFRDREHDGSWVKEFPKLLKSVVLDYGNEESQKMLYDELKSSLSVGSSEAISAPLPLSITLYTLRSILYPTVIYDQAIDVIRLIAHVEEIRIHAGQRARDILQWNERFQKMQRYDKQPGGNSRMKNVRTMEEGSEEERVVQKAARERRGQGALGKAYRRLIGNWQMMDIYHLWLSPESSHLLPAHIETYFPEVWPVPGETISEKRERVEKIWRRERIHWWKLSSNNTGQDEQQEEEIGAGAWCLGFVRDAAEWTVDRKTFCRSKGLNEKATFAEVFDPPVNEEALLTVSEKYITRVEALVDSLQIIFGDHDT